MRATVSAKSLKSAVSWVSKVVKSRSSLPILECILLSAEDGRITVKATDLEVMLSRSVNATVMEATPVCVNAKSLRDYLSKIKGKNATVSIESKPILLVVLEANGITVTLPDGNPENYPLAPHDIEWANAISLDPNAIPLKQIAKFASPGEGRPVLECVLVEVYPGGQYRLTAADGFRLVTTNAIQGEPTASYLLPAKAAEMMASLKASGTLRFGSQKHENGPTLDYAEFVADDSTVTSRLEEGRFPDYSQIIPASDRGTWVQFDTQALTERLESFVAMSGKPYLTKLELFGNPGNRAMLSASDDDGNEASTELPVDWTGEEGFVIAFNAKYMLDCLALCGEQTRIMLENASRPLLIEGTGCQMVVMPMHVKG